MFTLKYTLVLCLVFNVVFSAVIEKYAGTICNLQDKAGVNECIRKAIQHIFDQSSKGVKDIDLISFNPLQLSKAALTENRGGPTQLELYFTNAKHHHLAESTIEGVKYDIKTRHLEFIINNPLTLFEGQYKMSGKLLALPIHGEGEASIKMTNLVIKVEMNLPLKDGKDNKKYIRAENIKCKINPEKTNFKFENLFGNKELSDSMNIFLNENDKDVMAEMSIALEALYDKIIDNMINRLFASKPAQELIVL